MALSVALSAGRSCRWSMAGFGGCLFAGLGSVASGPAPCSGRRRRCGGERLRRRRSAGERWRIEPLIVAADRCPRASTSTKRGCAGSASMGAAMPSPPPGFQGQLRIHRREVQALPMRRAKASSGQKEPARAGAKGPRIGGQHRRRVVGRIDAERHQADAWLAWLAGCAVPAAAAGSARSRRAICGAGKQRARRAAAGEDKIGDPGRPGQVGAERTVRAVAVGQPRNPAPRPSRRQRHAARSASWRSPRRAC